jgi:PAS domain S-box-containing protein
MPASQLRISRPGELDALGEALSAFGVGLTLVDREMRVEWANRWILGMARELSCGGSHCFSGLWKASQRCSDCLPLLVFRTGEPQEGLRERARPGSPLEAYRVRAVPVLDASGELRWVAESFVRLSGPGALADLAAGGKSLAAEAAAASGAAFVVVDAQERIVSWGPAAAEVFGWALDEALGKRIDLLVPPERQAEERAIAEEVAQHGRFPRTETVRRARDGRLVPVALSAVALRDESGALIGRSCALEDLSALHHLRGRLAAQEQLLAHVTREAADAILGVGQDGRVTGFNRAAEGLLGTRAPDALGRPLAEVSGDEGAPALLARVEREKVVRGVRSTWRRSTGEAVPVEVTAALLAGGGVALVARDLSSQLEIERRMMRSEKLAVVGSLAAGLAHEIGTPLNVISATAEYLMLDGAPDERERRLRDIVGETDRISRLVRELLTFARGRGAERAPVDVRAAVEKVLSLLTLAAEKKRVRLEVDVPESLPRALADADGLHQVLVNLLVNAVNAVSEGGRVGVRVRAADGRGLAFEVHDDGPGVPEALRERIFDPFFTTRPDGTGLGLAVCARIVAAHGGDIRVGTGPLGGACFTVQLPAAGDKPPPYEAAA